MRCTHAYRTEVDGKEVLSTPEYETWGMMAGNLGIDDSEVLFKLCYIADDLGLDTIGAGHLLCLLSWLSYVGFELPPRRHQISMGIQYHLP
ncbi:MAG: aldehyde ferredoxin oxidoreductase C-terminal domain-containing protein [Candidatus Thorarchaeota archaeon]